MKKIKIIFHSPRVSNTIGGGEKKIIQIASNLIKRDDFEVLVITADNITSPLFANFINIYSDNVILLSNSRKYSKTSFEFTTNDPVVQSALTFTEASKSIYGKLQADLIITDFIPDFINLNVPYKKIINIGGFPETKDVATEESKYILDVSAFICAGKYVRHKFHEMYPTINLDKVFSIPNGIDDTFFEYFDIDSFRPIDIIYVGRLTQRKGIHLVLEALNIIRTKYNQLLNFTIVGKGEYEFELKKITKEFNLENQVTFIGEKMPTEISIIESNAKIFVYDVLKPEAFGSSVVEAMSRGNVVITSGLGGISDYIVHEYNGLIINPNDMYSLSFSIINVINNWKKYRNVRMKAIKSANQFKESKMVSSYIQIYEKLS